MSFQQALIPSSLCAERYEGIHFPLLEDGALFKQTRSDPPEKLYEPIIDAFDSAIVDITPRQESGAVRRGGRGASR